MQKIVYSLEKVLSIFSLLSAGISLCFMLLITFLEVVARYVFSFSFGLADEYGGYLLVALTFLGIAYVFKKDAHIRIEFLTSKLTAKKNAHLRIITLLLFLVFAVVFSIMAYDFVSYSYIRAIRSLTMNRTLLWIPKTAMAMGFSMLSLAIVLRLIPMTFGRNRRGDK